MWYCVLQIADNQLLYFGQDEAAAMAAYVDGTYLAANTTDFEAHRIAARNVRYLRRGLPIPAEYARLAGITCELQPGTSG